MTGYLLLMNGEASFARSGWFVMIRAILPSVLDYEIGVTRSYQQALWWRITGSDELPSVSTSLCKSVALPMSQVDAFNRP